MYFVFSSEHQNFIFLLLLVLNPSLYNHFLLPPHMLAQLNPFPLSHLLLPVSFGCLAAVWICMGETVDCDGIWHSGTRSKRSIWSHKNRRKPSSHPYKTPSDSASPESSICCFPACLFSLVFFFSCHLGVAASKALPPDAAIRPHDKQWAVKLIKQECCA